VTINFAQGLSVSVLFLAMNQTISESAVQKRICRGKPSTPSYRGKKKTGRQRLCPTRREPYTSSENSFTHK